MPDRAGLIGSKNGGSVPFIVIDASEAGVDIPILQSRSGSLSPPPHEMAARGRTTALETRATQPAAPRDPAHERAFCLLVVMLTGIPTRLRSHSGWLAGRWWGGIDLRELGSGSTGCHQRACGRWARAGPGGGFLLDVLRQAPRCLLAKAPLLQPLLISDSANWWVGPPLAWAALARQSWAECWLGCKGGKGTWATAWGMLLGPWCRLPWSGLLRPVSGHPDGQPDASRSRAWWPP